MPRALHSCAEPLPRCRIMREHNSERLTRQPLCQPRQTNVSSCAERLWAPQRQSCQKKMCNPERRSLAPQRQSCQKKLCHPERSSLGPQRQSCQKNCVILSGAAWGPNVNRAKRKCVILSGGAWGAPTSIVPKKLCHPERSSLGPQRSWGKRSEGSASAFGLCAHEVWRPSCIICAMRFDTIKASRTQP
jgi:hypothetical protein